MTGTHHIFTAPNSVPSSGSLAWTSSAATLQSHASTGMRVFGVSLALFIAVAVARIQDVIPGLALLRPGKLLMIPLLVALVIAVPRWQLLSAMRTRTAKCIAIIAALGVLSIPLSIWPSNSATSFASALIPSLVLFVVASAGFADRRTARLCILTLVLCVGADALYLLVGPAPEIKGRPYIGTGLDPNESATLFVFTLPFAIALGVGREKKRWLGLAVALLMVAGVVKTGSRGGMLGLLVVAVVLILRAAPKRRWSYVLGVVACACTFALSADETRWARFRTIFDPQTDYNVTEREGRLKVWGRGMSYMLAHPVLGVGIHGFETAEGVLSGKVNEGFGIRYTAAHNAFVQVGAELGVVGLVAFIVALWSAGRHCRRIQSLAVRDHVRYPTIADEEGRLAAAAYCALLGLVATIFFLSLAYHPLTLFALAVCVGVRAGSPYDPNYPRPTPHRWRIGWADRGDRVVPRAAPIRA